jgi:hypothetical protein
MGESFKFGRFEETQHSYVRVWNQGGREAFSVRIKHRLIINDIGVHFALGEPSDAVFLL